MDSHHQQQDGYSADMALTNGSVVDASSPSVPILEQPTRNGETTSNYDDLFPSLPSGASNSASSVNPIGEWNRKPKLLSSTITQLFYIAPEERKERSSGGSFGGDDSHKVIRHIMDKTGAKIEMYSGKDQSLTFLITGKPESALRARRELFVNFQTEASVSITIPKEHHKVIFGKGASRLNELRTRTGTNIQMPKISEPANETIVISGAKEGIEKALHEIRVISDEQSKQSRQVLNIPKIYHPFINGANNENTKRLIAQHPSVMIWIPPISLNVDEISVSGEKEDVAVVVKEINDIHHEMELNCATVSVEVRKSQHRYIIGPKGHAINDILATTGVFVEMPPSDSISDTITLRGPQANLGSALTLVYEKANSVVSHHVSCPSWLHKYIIGKKGENIQKLTSDLQKVHVEFLDSEDSIKIEGPAEEVARAKDMLQSEASRLIEDRACDEVVVDAKYLKHIVGKGGGTVVKIKQDHDVNIIIPDNTPDRSSIIRIEGNQEGVCHAKKELEAMVSKLENEREKDLIIENRFHRQLIGSKGENIQKIRADFEQVQVSFPELGVSSDIVKLRGPRDDVDKCARVMNKMYKELIEANFQKKIPIFKQFHKYIIGKGGATIRKIRADTETRVDLPESDSDSDVITITGKKANVEQAQKMIMQIQMEMENVVTVDISIPSKIHNAMIGAGGKLIQSIMDDCGGVFITFPPSDSGSDKVTIRGPKEDVEKAKGMLLQKKLCSVTDEVRAIPSHHKFLIGRGGANILGIREKTGAKIIFPNENDTNRDVITILGTKESVAAAKKELEVRIKELDNVVEDTMVVDPKYHKHFVARRGEVLKNIGDECGGVVISFPRSGVFSDKVTLKGAKNFVESAKAKMVSIVEDLDNQITIQCEIDQVHHRVVMGPRGSKVQNICAEHNVQIKFPDKADTTTENGGVPDAGSDCIVVTGKKENAEAASAALKALIPVNIELDISFEFHRFIIGQKGSGVRQLVSRYDVNVKVPPPEEQSNIIAISGTRDNVEGAKKALEERVKELEAEKAEKLLKSFELKLNVNPEYHPKIIGRRGAIILQLRKDYDVNIQLPKKDDSDDWTISIVGYEKNAANARDAIMKIVSDIESMTKEEMKIDCRIHSMIIGRRGHGIRKIMSDYNVDIKLPREGDPDPNLVQIMGKEDNVLDCKDHLLDLEEEFLQVLEDRDWMDDHIRPSSNQSEGSGNRDKKKSEGFQIGKGAPWHGASDEAFPTLGGSGGAPEATSADDAADEAPVPAAAAASAPIPVWGPRRY